MRTIDTKGMVTPDRTLQVRVPDDIPPGEHHVVVIIEEAVTQPRVKPPFDFPIDRYGSWPSDVSLRREEMYDNEGR